MKSLRSSGMRSSCKTGLWSKSLQNSSILITTQLEGSSIPSFIWWWGIHTLQWLYRISTGNWLTGFLISRNSCVPVFEMAAPWLAWRTWRITPVVRITETPSFRSCPYDRRIGRARPCKGPLVKGQGPATRRP